MKKKSVVAFLTVIMMIFTLAPSASFAAVKATQGDEVLDSLESIYHESIKDRSKYHADVWAEIQEVYMEGREMYKDFAWDDLYMDYYYDEEEEVYATYTPTEAEPMVLLELLGELTWLKKGQGLPDVKTKYQKEISDTAAKYKKTNYNEYNWDMIQDCLYVGKKQLKNAKTYRDAAAGYYYAMAGMMYATDKEEIKEFIKEAIAELKQFVYFYLDDDNYSAPVWKSIENTYKEAKTKLNSAELETDIIRYTKEYGEKLAALSGETYPIDEDKYYALIEDFMEDAVEFLENADLNTYTDENLWDIEDLVWELEMDLEECTTRDEAEKLVSKTMSKLEEVPTRAEENSVLNSFRPKVTAAGKTGTSIQVSWTSNKIVDGYIVYRAASKNGTYKQIQKLVGSKSTKFTDTKLTFGKNYYYKVKAYIEMDFAEKLTKANAAVKATPKLCSPSVTLSKTGNKDVQLKWKQITGAKGYQIFRSNSVNGQFKLVKTIKKGSTVQWKDTSTKKGKTYCYKMRSYTTKADGTKKYSSYSTIKTIKR